MKELTLKQIGDWCGGKVSTQFENLRVDRMQSDSRKVRRGDLFVALRGEKADGHDFAEAAISHGAVAALVSRPIFVSHDRDEVYRLADRIVVMEHGRVETSGTKKDVFRDPHTRAAAALTGCKNISRAEILPDGSVDALDWGITLRKPGFSGGCVGIRMHDVRPGHGENEVLCDVAEVIENPFSFTVLLRPAGRTDTTPVGWEMEKDVWRAQQAEQLWVHFPAEGLLALEETEEQA